MEKFFYRVEEGDTVFSVADKFCLPYILIVKENRLCGEIKAGDLLYIEKCACPLYKVQPFDTIKSVAEKFCVSEQKIKENNGVEYLFYGLNIMI